MDLFEILENRELVLVDADEKRFVTWNRSNTFQIWDRTFEEIGIRTYQREFKTFEDARKYAIQYYDEFQSGVPT